MIDVSKIKPGDEVTVRIKVRDVSRTGVGASVPGLSRAVWFPIEDIASHTPLQIQVGDRVRAKMTAGRSRYCFVDGEVIAVHDGNAWMRLSVGGYLTNHISDLERIP